MEEKSLCVSMLSMFHVVFSRWEKELGLDHKEDRRGCQGCSEQEGKILGTERWHLVGQPGEGIQPAAICSLMMNARGPTVVHSLFILLVMDALFVRGKNL